jgi:hypothetical protein
MDMWWYLDKWRQEAAFEIWGRKNMLRIAVVGDLSLQDPARLERVMAAAYKDCEIVVQIGDMHPGYDVVTKYAAMGKPVYAIRGNHDTLWDSLLDQPIGRWPKQWNHSTPLCHMVGLDNSADSFNNDDWAAVSAVPKDTLPILVFVHKPLSTIVLPDGSESNHIMGEGIANADAVKLQALLSNRNVLYCHGHFHGWTYMKTNYGDCLVEGRGGAAPILAYSIITMQEQGITLSQVIL